MNTLTRAARPAFVLAAIIVLFLCMRSAWRVGVSSLLARHARTALHLGQANRAVNTDSSNPEAHRARAIVLLNLNRWDEAVKEFEQAVMLRPRDYIVWLELGRARETVGNKEGALQALGEAVRLAPYYSKARWQYGNVLFRAGKREEGLTEMRRAAIADPDLLPVLIDLAWGTYAGDVEAVKRIISPETALMNLSLAHFLIRKGRIAEGMELYRAVGGMKEEEARALLTELLTAKRYREAYEVWSRTINRDAPASGAGVIIEPGFEGQINLKEAGFGWRQSKDIGGVQTSVDPSEPKEGGRSLHLEWTGNGNPGTPVLSQLVLVEQGASYGLRFAARTKDLVTGGLPVLVIADASGKDERVIAKSETFPRETNGWREYEIKFATGKTTEAVVIRLERESCTSNPCPIFGKLWLDNFSLQKN